MRGMSTAIYLYQLRHNDIHGLQHSPSNRDKVVQRKPPPHSTPPRPDTLAILLFTPHEPIQALLLSCVKFNSSDPALTAPGGREWETAPISLVRNTVSAHRHFVYASLAPESIATPTPSAGRDRPIYYSSAHITSRAGISQPASQSASQPASQLASSVIHLTRHSSGS